MSNIIRGTISAIAVVDGMGTRRDDGSYMEFVIQELGKTTRLRMSLGGAETLEAELHNILARAALAEETK